MRSDFVYDRAAAAGGANPREQALREITRDPNEGSSDLDADNCTWRVGPKAAHAAANVICNVLATMQNATSLLESRPQLLTTICRSRQPAPFRTTRRQQSTCIRADLADSSPAIIDTVTSSVQTTADALSVDPTVLAAGIGAIGGPAMHRTHADPT